MIATALGVILTIALVGLFIYLIETFLPLSPPFSTGIRVVGGIIVLIILIAFCAHLLGAPFPGAFKLR